MRAPLLSRHFFAWPISRRLAVALAVSLVAASSDVAAAASWDWATGLADKDIPGERSWEIQLTPYGWLAGVTGTLGAEPPAAAATAAVVEIGSVTDTLNGAFMATLELRWRRWRLIGDGFWTRFKDTEPLSPPFEQGTWEVSLAYGDAGVAYELPWHPGFAIDVTAEARWWRLSADIELVQTLPPATLEQGVQALWADFVAGVRLRRQLTDNWRVWAQTDVGGGAAKVDWSAEAGLGWDPSRYFGLVAAYRILGVNYRRDGLIYDINHSGILGGIRFAY